MNQGIGSDILPRIRRHLRITPVVLVLAAALLGLVLGVLVPPYRPPDFGPYDVVTELLPADVDPLVIVSGPDGDALLMICRSRGSDKGLLLSVDPAGGRYRVLWPTHTMNAATLAALPDSSGSTIWLFESSCRDWRCDLYCIDVLSGELVTGKQSFVGSPFAVLPSGLAFDTQGRLWVAWPSSDEILCCTLDGDRLTIRPFALPFWRMGDSIRFLTALPTGRIWITTSSGTYELDPDSEETGQSGRRMAVTRPVTFPTPQGERPLLARCVARAPGADEVWVVMGRLLFRHTPTAGTWENISDTVAGLPPVRAVYPTPGGDVWLFVEEEWRLDADRDRSGIAWLEVSTGRLVLLPAYRPKSGETLYREYLQSYQGWRYFIPHSAAVDAEGNLWFTARVRGDRSADKFESHEGRLRLFQVAGP